jgi:N6-adenosine-specific RNA methylase IME4
MPQPGETVSKRYDIVLADPPWLYYGSPTKDQAAGKHYPCMPLASLKAMRVQDIAAKPSVCFLWTTSSMLGDAVELLRAWGFTYRGVAYVWVKTNAQGNPIHGQGVRPTLTKPTTEFVLAGTTCSRGRPFPLRTEAQAQVLLAPRPANRHSAKPPEIRQRIVELLGDRPRIELFARDRETGWDVWGNEVTSDVELGCDPQQVRR